MKVRVRTTWLALVPAMTLPFVASLLYFVLFSQETFARVLYVLTKAFTLVWPLLAVRWLFGESWPRLELSALRHRKSLPMGMIIGAAIVAGMYALMQTPLGDMVLGGAKEIRAKTETLGVLNYYWSFALFLSVAHSLLEEYYWRWFVFGRLSQVVPKAWAHGLAGLAFSAHHIVITTQYFPLGLGFFLGVMVGVGGIIWSMLYGRQGSLAGCWVSHMLVDLGMLALGHRIIFGTYF